MSRRGKFFAAAVTGLWWFLFVFQLGAQEATEESSDDSAKTSGSASSVELPAVAKTPLDELTVESVKTALAAVEENSSLDAAVKDLLRPKFNLAIDTLNKAAQNKALAEQFRNSIDAAPRVTADVREELESLIPVEKATAAAREFVKDLDAKELQEKVDLQRAAATALKENLEKVSTALTQLKGRTAEINQRIPKAEMELVEASGKLSSSELEADASSPARIADRMLLRATVASLQNEITKLNQEQLSQKFRGDQLQAQLELLTRQFANEDAILKYFEASRNRSLSSEAQEYTARVNRILEQVPEENLETLELADQVQKTAVEYLDLVENLKRLKLASENVKSRYDRLVDEAGYLETQLELGGSGEVIARLIYEMQDRILRRGVNEALLSKLPTLDQARLAELEVNQAKREFNEFEQKQTTNDSALTSKLIEVRRELLTKLSPQYSVLVTNLSALQRDLDRYHNKAATVLDSVNEQLFWIKSYPPISVSSFAELPKGLVWVFQFEQWGEFGKAIYTQAVKMPVLFIWVTILIAVLLAFRRRIIRNLNDTGKSVLRISTDSYWYTTEALMWTLLLVLPLPIVFGFLSWTLSQVPETSNWLHGISDGMISSAWISLILGFMISVCRPKGLARAHFRWDKQGCLRYRAELIMFGWVYIPTMLVTAGTIYGNNASAYGDSVGRIFFMIAHLWIAYSFWRWLAADNGVVDHMLKVYPNWILTKTRYVWCTLTILAPIGLTLLSALGFFHTAIQLSLLLIATFGIVAVGEVCLAMTLRWYSCKKRKLALAEVMERRRLRREAEAGHEKAEAGEVVSVDAEDEAGLNLNALGEQTRHVFRMVYAVAVIMAITYLWSENIPIYSALENIKVPLTLGLSLFSLLKAILIAAVTWILVQNLPGLLELSVLRTTSFEAGTRYAIARLCQYIVTGIGLMAFFNVLQFDWSKFSWIAAALSVGLGFGLQEVVANFVCGLILLFERPVRVGDVVTLDNMTGTVTNIQMRSTTITNWDRQEFIVPNKQLITGTILNWTLSASINRVVIPVGIAYGSDTDKARQILLDVASDHPLILQDPGPSANFEQFADSSLQVILRAYLPDLDNRLNVITELHTEINRQFSEEGIEIAFPQLDIHVQGGGGNPAEQLVSEQRFD